MTEIRTGDVEPRTAGQQRADWWHARMAEDPLLGPCGGTHALGYATCQRIAAIEQDAGREARRLALAEELDLERLAEAMVTVMPAFYRGFDDESVREATADAGAIAAEYKRLGQ